MDKYKFRRYDSHYPDLFNQEYAKLAKTLGDEAIIEHVGSTAVPNLGGKGIIDILIGCSNLVKFRNQLEEAGYEFREVASTKNRLFFRKDYIEKGKQRRVHIHLVKNDKKDFQEMITFRDWLRSHPKDLTKYAELKKESVAIAKGDGQVYRKYKEKFIQEITRKELRK